MDEATSEGGILLDIDEQHLMSEYIRPNKGFYMG
jgi:hypothetical protein